MISLSLMTVKLLDSQSQVKLIQPFVFSPSPPAAWREEEYLPIGVTVESRSWLAYVALEIRSLKKAGVLDTAD